MRLVTAVLALSLAAPSLADPCPKPENSTAFFSDRNVTLYRDANGLGAIPQDFQAIHREWADLTKKLGEPAPESYFSSCHLGYARRIFEERRRAFGDTNPYIRFWLRNQNAVFSACDFGGGEQALTEPKNMPPETAALAGFDFAYQQAALLYYKNDHEAAKAAFARIAADTDSPHRAVAAYMTAQIDFQATVRDSPDERQALDRAQPIIRQIDALLDDPAMAPAHHAARQLRDAVAYWTAEPKLIEAQTDQIGRILSRPKEEIGGSPELREDYVTALDDLRYFLTAGEPDGPRSEAARALATRWPVLDWLQLKGAGDTHDTLTGWLEQSPDGTASLKAAALKRLAAEDSPLWALAALGLAGKDDAHLPELLARFDRQQKKLDACAMPPWELHLESDFLLQGVRLRLATGDIPAALAALELHAARSPDPDWHPAAKLAAQWLILRDRPDDARRVLALFPARDGEVAGLRELLARDFGEFRAAIAPVDSGNLATPAVLTLMPTARLIEVARDTDVPKDWRTAAARVAWTRSYLLGGPDQARTVSPLLAELDPIAAVQLRKFDKTSDPVRAGNLATVLLGRMPGLHIDFTYYQDEPWSGRASGESVETLQTVDHSDGNWWCPLDPAYDRQTVAAALFDEPLEQSRGAPQFAALRRRLIAAHPVLKLADAQEQAKLAAAPSAPKLLSENAVEWAKSSTWLTRLLGRDRALPEALALAVKTTRYGCERAGGHGAYSRAAYEELHKRYPKSDRTVATRYWFDCGHFRRGCGGPYSLAGG